MIMVDPTPIPSHRGSILFASCKRSCAKRPHAERTPPLLAEFSSCSYHMVCVRSICIDLDSSNSRFKSGSMYNWRDLEGRCHESERSLARSEKLTIGHRKSAPTHRPWLARGARPSWVKFRESKELNNRRKQPNPTCSLLCAVCLPPFLFGFSDEYEPAGVGVFCPLSCLSLLIAGTTPLARDCGGIDLDHNK